MKDILVRLALNKQKFVDFLWEYKDLSKRHYDYAYAHFFFFFFEFYIFRLPTTEAGVAEASAAPRHSR